jgi:hypothetical protein
MVVTELQRYKLAYSILQVTLNGGMDSGDASDIASLVIAGTEINWDDYSESTHVSLTNAFKE